MDYIIEKSYVDITGSFEGSVILQTIENITRKIKNKDKNFDGYIPLSLEDIKRLTGLTVGVTTIRRYVAKLEKKGFILTKKDKALNNINCYYCNTSEIKNQVKKQKKPVKCNINNFISEFYKKIETKEEEKIKKDIKSNKKIKKDMKNNKKINENIKNKVKFIGKKEKGLKTYENIEKDLKSYEKIKKLDFNLEGVKSSIKKQINYEYLIAEHCNWQSEIEGIVDIMMDVYTSEQNIKISSEMKPAKIVKSVFKKLDYGNIEAVIQKFKKQVKKIYSIKNYLVTSLYNQAIENGFYWGNQVKSDFYNMDWAES